MADNDAFARAARRIMTRGPLDRASRPRASFSRDGAESVAQIIGVEFMKPRERVEKFLQLYNIRPKSEVLDVLARCDSGAEVWFALAMTHMPQFNACPPDTLCAGRLGLQLQVPLCEFTIDFVLTAPTFKKSYAIEIDGAPWHGANMAARDARKDEMIFAHGMIPVRRSSKAMRTEARAFWIHLLKQPQHWYHNDA